MRAVVKMPFHHPVSGKMLHRATVLSDADLLPWIDDPQHADLKHHLVFSDRKPEAKVEPVVPAAVKVAPAPAPAAQSVAAQTVGVSTAAP